MLGSSQESKKALGLFIGHIELIYSIPRADGGLNIVFRSDGELRGVAIYEIDYHGRTHEGGFRQEMTIKPLKREAALRQFAFIALDENILFTEAEQAEWDQICAEGERKKKEQDKQWQEEAKKRRRREYEELKKEFDDNND